MFRSIRLKLDTINERREKKNDFMLKLAHKELDVWQKTINLITNVYKLTNSFPKDEQFGLTSQLRRASISIISNLSEGFARSSELETKRFFDIARASLVEVDTQI